MNFVDCPSPNHDERPESRPPTILVLHYTGMETVRRAIERLCNPEARVSAHYTVDEDGTVYVHVPENRRAWHAGASYWQGETDVNGASIGIEIVNPGHEFGYRPFPAAQMAVVTALAKRIVLQYRILPLRVVGHSDIAPERKTDPGELFDWQALAAAGVGFWPAPESVEPHLYDPFTQKPDTVGRNLCRIGYHWPVEPTTEEPRAAYRSAQVAIVGAFQRHYRSGRLTGTLDAETAALAAVVAAARD